MQPSPQWSEKIDERGMPADPLNANRSRNRVANLFAHGLITSITLRLRYTSIFCWGLSHLSEDADDPYTELKNLEKLFGLSSRYYQLQEDHEGEALRGMDGNSRFNYDSDEFDDISLDDLELLKNDGYAYAQFYENLLQKFLLKRGEFELTEAGEEIAEIIDRQLEEHRNRILRCTKEGRATRDDFDAFAAVLANQSLYKNSGFEDERRALQKVLLGFLEWTGDKRTGTVELTEQIPSEIPLTVLEQLRATIEAGDIEEAGSSKLYQKYNRGYHRYRASHSCFLLRSWQLQSNASGERLALSAADKQSFQQYRELMRLYWLQVYAGYAVEAQLEALCTFLNSRIPARYDYDALLTEVTTASRMQRAFDGIVNGFEAVPGEDEAGASQLTRNLLLYGEADRMAPSVSGSEPQTAPEYTVGSALAEVEDIVDDGWDSTPPVAGVTTVNEVLLAKAIRKSLAGLRNNVDDEATQFSYWADSLARSVALLCLVVARFRRLKQSREWLYNYAYNRFDTTYASLPSLERFISNTEADTPLPDFARTMLDEQVVETHLRVFYSRLSPGNLKRAVSFDQDERLCLEVDAERGSPPFTAQPHFIRFSELNTFLRDVGLLIETSEGYDVSDRGAELLARITGGDDL